MSPERQHSVKYGRWRHERVAGRLPAPLLHLGQGEQIVPAPARHAGFQYSATLQMTREIRKTQGRIMTRRRFKSMMPAASIET